MTEQEYEAYFEELKERGYKLAGNPLYGHPYYYKVIEYRKDKYGDNRAVCQLLFYFYELKDNRSGNVYYSIVPIVVVSRNTEERLDFTISHPKRSIKDYERIAKEFMKWVDINIKL